MISDLLRKVIQKLNRQHRSNGLCYPVTNGYKQQQSSDPAPIIDNIPSFSLDCKIRMDEYKKFINLEDYLYNIKPFYRKSAEMKQHYDDEMDEMLDYNKLTVKLAFPGIFKYSKTGKIIPI